jgi:hypothetical protein
MFVTEASRERWTLGVAIGALLISGGALFFTYRQWKSSERAVDVADQARKDANIASDKALSVAEQARRDAVMEAEKQRVDGQNTLAVQRRDAAAALEAQTKRADRANVLADRSAKAAEETAKTSAEQLDVADRPWVSIDMNVIGPLTFDANGANLKTLMTLRNSGHSPAAGLWILGELLSMAATDLTVERDRLCEEAKAQATTNPRMATTLFPTSDYNREWIFTSGKESLENAIKENHGIIIPALIVCVAYRPAFTMSVHKTARIYWVMDANDPRNPQNALAVITDGSTPIPAGRLRLMVVDLGGIYAD